jgi:KDO2-lipid IV(A) lauroyltransferase
MGRKGKRSAVRNWLEFVPIRLLFGVLGRAPQWISYPLVAGLGRLYLRLDGKRRCIALAGLRRAFPQAGDKELLRIAYRSSASFARILVDVARMPRAQAGGLAARQAGGPAGGPTDRPIPDWVDCSEFDALLAEVAQRYGDVPVILCTPHLGSWEAAITAAAFRLNPLHLIGRRMENPLLDRYLFERRSRFGQKVYAKKGGIRPLAQALRAGESVAFAADQNQRRGKAFVRYFGELASCDRGPIRLAEQFGAPVLIGAAVRVGRGFRFKMLPQDSFRVRGPDGDPGDPDAEEALQRLHRAFEEIVLRYPDQYLWMHDRWRTRPKEDAVGEQQT